MNPTSVLSDGTIRRLVEEGRIKIDPWDAAMVQPASVDLRLGNSFRVFHNHRVAAIDLRDPPQRPDRAGRASPTASRSSIHPGEFVPRPHARSGSSCPTTSWPASRENRRLGRLGLIVHATAGFVDPGLEGHADARDHQPHARPDQALARAADRAALVHDARRARPSARTATRTSAATTTARSRRRRAATRAGLARRRCPAPIASDRVRAPWSTR